MSVDEYLANLSVKNEADIDYHDWDKQWQKIESEMEANSLAHELEEQKSWQNIY
jgi:hypothetical protein